MKKLGDLLGKELLFFDGGTGTVLQGMGLKPGELPETWNTKHPDRIVQLHYNYFAAGSNIVNTNTFGAFITKFPLELERFIKAAIENANEARERVLAENPDGNYFIAFDIGSCGKLLKPMGDLDFEDCVKLFKKTFAAAFPLAKEDGPCGLAKINPLIKAKLQLPRGHKVVNCMIIGYPDVEYRRIPPRKPLKLKKL